MQSPNYFSGIVKILEVPQERIFNDKIRKLTFRVLIPPMSSKKSSKIISLVLWRRLTDIVPDLLHVNNYILIEGYTSIQIARSLNTTNFNSKKVIVNVLKTNVYSSK